MLEKWKSALDKNENVYALYMDRSKTLKAYGLSKNALKLVLSF